MKAPYITTRTTDTASRPYWATVQLLDGSELSGLISEENHSGVRLYRVERRGADGTPVVEYYGFISISCVVPTEQVPAAPFRA